MSFDKNLALESLEQQIYADLDGKECNSKQET